MGVSPEVAGSIHRVPARFLTGIGSSWCWVVLGMKEFVGQVNLHNMMQLLSPHIPSSS